MNDAPFNAHRSGQTLFLFYRTGTPGGTLQKPYLAITMPSYLKGVSREWPQPHTQQLIQSPSDTVFIYRHEADSIPKLADVEDELCHSAVSC